MVSKARKISKKDKNVVGFSTRDICSIIRCCNQQKVKSLKFKGLELEMNFPLPNIDHDDFTEQPVRDEPAFNAMPEHSRQHLNSVPDEAPTGGDPSEEDEDLPRGIEEEAAQLNVTDPDAYFDLADKEPENIQGTSPREENGGQAQH